MAEEGISDTSHLYDGKTVRSSAPSSWEGISIHCNPKGRGSRN